LRRSELCVTVDDLSLPWAKIGSPFEGGRVFLLADARATTPSLSDSPLPEDLREEVPSSLDATLSSVDVRLPVCGDE
jgi:hypothetical protein